MRYKLLGGQSALDQAGRRQRLDDCALAGSAAIFGPARDQHPKLRWAHVEPFGRVLADPMHDPTAAGAGLALDVDHDLDAWQMRRQSAAIEPALRRTSRLHAGVPTLLLGLSRGDGLLDILESEIELIGLEPLRTAAEPGALQLADDLTQALVLIPGAGKLRGVCRVLGQEQRAQLFGIIGKVLGRVRHPVRYDMHLGRHEGLSRTVWPRESLCRSYCVAAGTGGSTARTRVHSMPLTSAASCAAVRRTVPSSIRGQRKPPCSSRFAKRQSPEPPELVEGPPNQLDSIRSLRPEHEHGARERIVLQILLHQRREAIHSFAEVDRPRRDEDPNGPARYHHRADRSAFTSATIVAGRVPAGTRNLAPLSSISMISPAVAAALGPSPTTGAKLRAGGDVGFVKASDRRQRKICAGVSPYLRATALTFAPGAVLSATIRVLSSALQLRRRPAPVKISTRRAGAALVLGSSCVSVIVPAAHVKGHETLTLHHRKTGAPKASLTFEERKPMKECRSYNVGYGKPPVHTRFKKGQSGKLEVVRGVR